MALEKHLNATLSSTEAPYGKCLNNVGLYGPSSTKDASAPGGQSGRHLNIMTTSTTCENSFRLVSCDLHIRCLFSSLYTCTCASAFFLTNRYIMGHILHVNLHIVSLYIFPYMALLLTELLLEMFLLLKLLIVLDVLPVLDLLLFLLMFLLLKLLIILDVLLLLEVLGGASTTSGVSTT